MIQRAGARGCLRCDAGGPVCCFQCISAQGLFYWELKEMHLTRLQGVKHTGACDHILCEEITTCSFLSLQTPIKLEKGLQIHWQHLHHASLFPPLNNTLTVLSWYFLFIYLFALFLQQLNTFKLLFSLLYGKTNLILLLECLNGNHPVIRRCLFFLLKSA